MLTSLDAVQPSIINALKEAQTAEKQVPENGLFRKVFVSFSVPDTDNKAKYCDNKSVDYNYDCTVKMLGRFIR